MEHIIIAFASMQQESAKHDSKSLQNMTLVEDRRLPLETRTYVCYHNRNYNEGSCDYEQYAVIG